MWSALSASGTRTARWLAKTTPKAMPSQRPPRCAVLSDAHALGRRLDQEPEREAVEDGPHGEAPPARILAADEPAEHQAWGCPTRSTSSSGSASVRADTATRTTSSTVRARAIRSRLRLHPLGSRAPTTF